MLWFYHIPHTGGRGLGRFLWPIKIQYLKIHNDKDFIDAHKGDPPNNKYFILRDPIDRSYKEFLHYSSRLKQINTVGHLNIEDILKKNPLFNHFLPNDYFSLENNRNLMCKFLLEREDFSIPISKNDYDMINISNFTFDLFTDLPNLPNLRKILDVEIVVPSIGMSKKEIVPSEIKKIIVENNNFDLLLYKKIV